VGRLGNVLIIGGEPLLVDALRARLSSSDIRVDVADSGNCMMRAREVQPAVILLPYPGPLSPRIVSRLANAAPSAKLVVLADGASPDVIGRFFRAGVDAWLDKCVEPADLAAALRLVLGQTLYLPAVAPELPPAAATLTERELVILKALARGLSNRRIARELWVTEQTVKFHLTNVFKKLSTANRTEAARYAIEHGLVDRDEEASEAAPLELARSL
jgi:DNA-binding NarL/FixJ family response regulator